MLSLASFILVTIALLMNLVAIVKFFFAVRAKNYEKLSAATSLIGYAAVLQFVRVIVNIGFDTDRFLMALGGFLVTLVAYLTWSLFVKPLFKQYAVPDPVEQASRRSWMN
jgi:nitrogen fixation-related uncharacterized protein